MEDYILREIDRIGEMLLKIARKMGLFLDEVPDYSLSDVKDEFGKAGFPYDLDTVLRQGNPVRYLADDCGISDQGLESFIDIIFHSDLDEDRKEALLRDALAYLDAKGYCSFRLHSYLPSSA